MRRGIAVVWYAVSFVVAACLYFFFVLPRWPELTGDITHTWGTVLRIVTGVVLGLTALPVVLTLLRTRRPEFGTPQLALSLRTWSIVGHVLAAAMIIVTAVVEIWVSLDTAGSWLFGVYGAAAALAVLALAAFDLAFLAELPPPPPKPVKPKKLKSAPEPSAEATEAEETAAEAATEAEADDSEAEAEPEKPDEPPADEKTDEPSADEKTDEPEAEASEDAPEDEPAADLTKPARTRLRNRRPRKAAGATATEE